MVGSELRHLLVIVAYRDNEVASTDPLVTRLESIRQAGAKVGQITLTPLGRGRISRSSSRMLSIAQRRAPVHLRRSSMIRLAAIHISPSGSCSPSPRKV